MHDQVKFSKIRLNSAKICTYAKLTLNLYIKLQFIFTNTISRLDFQAGAQPDYIGTGGGGAKWGKTK